MKKKEFFITCFITLILAVIIFAIGYSLFDYKITKPYEFPIYQNQSDYNSSNWKTYIDSVYKNSPSGSSNFPLDLSNFSILYKEKLSSAGITVLDKYVYDDFCTLQNNTLNSVMNWGSTANDFYWLRKLPPYKCIPNNTQVEVFHSAGDNFGWGSWFYAVEGSGIWFDVGTTICFKKHNDAVEFFLNRSCNTTEKDDLCDPFFVDMITAANDQGYKSIQFTEHGDQVCGLRAMEIVHVQGTGYYNCTYDPNDANFGTCVFNNFKTGWDKSIGCSCDYTKNNLNCDLSS